MSDATTVVYSDALVLLGTAGVVIPLVRRWGLSPVLGYLGAGAILGPLGLGSLSNVVPGLWWITITDAQNVSGIAELGIVFLLFLIGLELSFPRLSAMRRLVIGLGGSQVLLTSALIAGVAMAFGKSPSEAIVIGSGLSLSSTAIVLELLSSQERLTTGVGRASFSVLLAQDIAVIPIFYSFPFSRLVPAVRFLQVLPARCCRPQPRSSSLSPSAVSCCGRCSGWSRPRALPRSSLPRSCL